MSDIDERLTRLRSSAFRRRFTLRDRDLTYVREKGLDTVLDHARTFVEDRLAPATPRNDGKQTPFKGHPVFVAQHATATCCRGCLEKWHEIPRGRALSAGEREYVISVIARWIHIQTGA